MPDRNKLVAELLAEIIEMIDEFENKGFAAFKNEWGDFDASARPGG